MVENIQSFCVNAAYACAASVGVFVIAYGTVCGMKFLSGGVKSLAAVSLVGSLIIGGMVMTSVYVAGAKTNDAQQVGGDLSNTNDVGQVEGGTNGVEQVGGDDSGTNAPPNPLTLPLLGLRLGNPPEAVSFVTDEDISSQWRVVSVSSNVLASSTFTMPAHATVWEDARDFGAGWGSWKIPLGGWQFSFGDVGWTNGFAWVEGCFRSRFNSRANEIRILSERLALCPAANWSRYNLAASRAWCATNDEDGLIVTFENAAIGDDPTKIASAQMELFPRTGEVALRYDLANVGDATYTAGLVVNGTNHFVTVGAGTREVVFQRVHPDDWDMDGLPNLIDDNPRAPSPNTGYNQTDIWAMAAYPSDATEIASLGYAAWAAAWGATLNRHLIGLQVSSPENVWPICLTFGGAQVMCDGSEMLYFSIDDGARYSFELSDGALTAVDFDGTELLDGLPIEWSNPWEYQSWPSMVTLHIDSARFGWIGRMAEVSVDGLDNSHFFPNGSETVTAVVTNCHEDAYTDCTWSGGEGISFSDNHSLSTTINWNSTNGVAWATNYVDLVTTYEGGYALTNHHGITVGTQTEPATSLELLCPTNMFINSTQYSNYVERVYSAVVKVTVPHGSRGQLWLDADDGSGILLYADRERTTRMSLSVPIEISKHGEYGTNVSFYVSCPRLGMGRIEASLFLTNGTHKVEHVDVLVIEPERRLVTDEHDERSGIIVNPSRLVYGTNAVLKVGVHQSGSRFNPMNISWHPISHNCRITPTNGLSVVVEPTTDSGVAVVEARFNGDAVQPRFVLPIMRWRELAVKAFVVQPPEKNKKDAWTEKDINETIAAANSVYSQIGVRFNLQEIVMEGVGTSSDWVLQRGQVVTNGNRKAVVLSNQAARLFDHHKLRDCIELYFVGTIIPGEVIAFHHPNGIAISKKGADSLAVAHEIGHALGMKDCYALNKVGVTIGKENAPVARGMFSVAGPDWGDETSHGYYSFDDSLGKMLRSMLMCGRVYDGEFGMDIPDDWIESLEANTLSTNQTTHATVGARAVEARTDAEIYSK